VLYTKYYIYGYTIKDNPIVDVNTVDSNMLNTFIASHSIVLNFGGNIVFKV
jgi:hypothetical protein